MFKDKEGSFKLKKGLKQIAKTVSERDDEGPQSMSQLVEPFRAR